MNRFCALAALALIGISMPAAASTSVRVGAPAPSFAIDGVTGEKIRLEHYRGHPVFLNFFATWCAPCKLELPYIVMHYPEYRDRVAFLGIDEQESPQPVGAFAKRLGITYPVGIDQGNAAAAYAVGAIPESVFIDRNGIVRAVNKGYLTPALLEQDLALIAGH